MGKEKSRRVKRSPKPDGRPDSLKRAAGVPEAPEEEYSHLADNVKAVLIFLVVFNHLIAFHIVKVDEVMRHVWYAITIFHMPAFIFVSGYLSKHPQNQLKNFKNLMIPYILGYSLTWYAYHWLGQPIDYELLRPSGSAMWYLLALFFYRLTVEASSRFRGVVLWSIVLALAAGFRPEFSTYLSASRIVVFFPFFVAGYLWRSSDTQYIRRFTGKIAFLTIGGVLLFSVPHYMILNRLPIDLFRGNHSYQMSGVTGEMGLILRFLMYLVSFVVIMMLFSLMPQRKLLGFIGRNTMSVFFFHYPILIVMNGLGILALPELSTWWGALLLSLGMVLVLASPPVFWIYSKIMQLVGFILFRSEKGSEPQKPSAEEAAHTRRAVPPAYKRRSISLAHRSDYGNGDLAYDVADDESVGYNVYGYREPTETGTRTGYSLPEDYYDDIGEDRFDEERIRYRRPGYRENRPAPRRQPARTPVRRPMMNADMYDDPDLIIDAADEFARVEEETVPSVIRDDNLSE